MGQKAIIANAKIDIDAPASKVWDALINPELVRQYLYGAEIVSNWYKGSPIVFKGVWNGRAYADKGIILEIEPGKLLKVTHYSPLSGLPDVPENYHMVTYQVSEAGGKSTLAITQENNRDQAEVDESERTWGTILGNIKALLEHVGR
jgi:uncharacterized protein YndB with AHSA1/START domain